MKIMIAVLLATVSLIPLASGAGSLSLAECKADTDGYSWWAGFVKKQCRYTTAKSEIILVACKTPVKGIELKPGGDTRDGDFHYDCHGDERALELVVKHCYLPDGGAAIMVGMKVKADGGEYHCITQTVDGKTAITRTFAKYKAGCLVDGKRVEVGEILVFDDTVTNAQCLLKDGEGVMEAIGCRLPNGETVPYWTSKDGVFCQPVNKQKSELVKKDLTCDDNEGNKVQLFDSWKVDMSKYRCEYANLEEYMKDPTNVVLTAKPEFYACYQYVYYEEEGVKKKYRFGVTRNYQGQARDGNFYQCQLHKDSKTGERYGVMVKLTIEECTCTRDGVSWLISTYKVIDGVRYRCSWREGGAINYVKDCQTEDGESVAINKMYDAGDYGMVCVQGDGVVIWRRMTDVEYDKWKSGDNNAVSALGGGGAGEGRDNEQNVVCKQGFHAVTEGDTKICKDIDECAIGGHNCDSSSERCQNTEGAWKCLCKMGEARRSDNKQCEVLTCPPCAG